MKLENQLRWNSEDWQGGSKEFGLYPIGSGKYVCEGLDEMYPKYSGRQPPRRERRACREGCRQALSFQKAAVFLFVASGHCPSIPDGQLRKVFWFNSYVFKTSGNSRQKNWSELSELTRGVNLCGGSLSGQEGQQMDGISVRMHSRLQWGRQRKLLQGQEFARGGFFGRYLELPQHPVQVSALQADGSAREGCPGSLPTFSKDTGGLLIGQREILVEDASIQLAFKEHSVCQTPGWVTGPQCT